MVQQFFAGLAEISPILPWLVRGLIIIIVLSVVWVVLAIPAFWLCRAIGNYVRSARDSLLTLTKALAARAVVLFSGCMGPINDFTTSHAQMFSFAQENIQIKGEIEKLRSSVEAIPNKIASLELNVTDAEKKFTTASDAIVQFESPGAMQAPSSQDFAAVKVEQNVAVVKLILAIIFMPVLIAFNTGMLNEFFSAFLGDLEVLGLPLAPVLAFGMTVVELVLGGLMVFVNRPVQIGLGIGIAVLAFIEINFYARVGQEFNWSVFDSFYPVGAAPAWTKLWLGVFGPVLVLGIAIVGHTLFSAIHQLAINHVVRQWRRYVTSRMQAATDLKHRLGDADRARQLLTGALTEVQTTFSTTKGVAGSSLTVIESSRDTFLEQIRVASQIRLADNRKLDRGAMLRQFFECLVFAAVAMFALSIIAWTFTFFPVPRLLLWLSGLGFGWTVALAEAVVLLIAGSAVTRSNTTLPAAEGIPATNPNHSAIGPFVGLAILIAVIGANAFYTLQPISSFNAMLWALLVAANVGIFWCGTRLGMIAAAVWAMVCALAYVAASVAVGTAAVLLGGVWIALGIFLMVLVALAYPYSFLFLRDSMGTQILPRIAQA